jgi:hypothetical protein
MFNSEEILEFSRLPDLRYPNNIVDSDKIIFDSYLNQTIPKMEVKALNNVLVSPYGIIYKNFSILKECTPYYFSTEREDMQVQRFMKKYINSGGRLFSGSIERLIRHFILCEKTSVRETHFWCSDQYSHYYMHWLSETLPRIYLLSLLEVENPKVILPGPMMKNISFIKESLDLLFPDIEFSFTKNRNVLKFRELVWISQMGQSSLQFNPHDYQHTWCRTLKYDFYARGFLCIRVTKTYVLSIMLLYPCKYSKSQLLLPLLSTRS